MLDRIEALFERGPEKAEKFRKARESWQQLRENHQKLVANVLKLMRHPDATDAQVLECRRIYRDSYARVKDAQKHMREKYGNRSWIEDIGVE